MKKWQWIIILYVSNLQAVPIKDNILFAFDRCRELRVDLEKGQLKESLTTSFDLVCKKVRGAESEFQCEFFDTQTGKKILEEKFTGGSDLGVARLNSATSAEIKFLIGKKFASYDSIKERRVCVGIYLFEKDALKKKSNQR